MAEPAKKPVYDNDYSEKPITKPDLKALEGGGETTPREHGHLTSVDKADKTVPKEKLADAEKAGAADAGAGTSKTSSGKDQIGSGYNTTDNSRRSVAKRVMGQAGRHKKSLIGTGIAGGLITAIIVTFLSLLPLKIVSIIENLQNHFYATSENAVQKESENMLSSYLKINAKACGSSVITKGCSPSYIGSSPVANLFKVWHQNKLENTMSEKYGIEVKYNSSGSGQYYLKAPGLSGDTAVDGTGDVFTAVNRGEVRAAVDDALSQETRWKQVLYRFKIGRLLEEKYGIKRCLTTIGCHVSDSITDTLQKPKRAAEVFLAERVLYPRSQILGQVLLCLAKPGDCDPNSAKSVPCTTDTDCEINGAAETVSDTEMRTTLDKLVAKFVGDDAYQIFQDISEDNNGLTGYLLKQVASYAAEQTGGDEAAQAAAAGAVDDALPVVGWVNLASNIIGHLQTLGPTIKKLQYVTNAASMVSLYMMYRTYADQVKSGHVDPTEVGSFNDALGPGAHSDTVNAAGQDPNEVGGTASAESSPIYDTLINNGDSTTTASIFQNLLPGTAYAASSDATSSNDYKCASGSVPATGSVCPEENLAGGNAILNSVSSEFTTGALSSVGTLADIFNNTIGKGLGIVGDIISNIPGLSSITGTISGLIGNLAKPLISKIINFLIPNPFGSDMSGARTFDLLAGGADVSGNDYAHHGLGGQQLTPAQTATIMNEQEQQAQTEFKQEPLYARLFDKTNQYSLVSRVATALPSSGSLALTNGFSSLLDNPFGRLMDSFASIFTSPHVFAIAAAPDPFGVSQYGYPDSAIPSDPDSFWNQNCQDGSYTQNWNNASTTDINANTGNPENTGTDPCLLIQAAVGSDGGFYSNSLLTPDDLADSNGTGTIVNSTGPSNKSVYIIGDSISAGMYGQGDLSSKLLAAGWNLTDTSPFEGNSGFSLEKSIPLIATDTTPVSQAGTVVVELGTNDCSLYGPPPPLTCDSAATIEPVISQMISAIRAVNPTAQIDWVNIYSTKSTAYQSINDALTAESTPDNFKIIDWATEATTNASKYSFDTGPMGAGVHQTAAANWSNMSDFIVGSL